MDVTQAPGASHTCTVCGKPFEPKFRFQLETTQEGHLRGYCSQSCRMQAAGLQATPREVSCSVCGIGFVPQYVAQQVQIDNAIRPVCSSACREQVLSASARPAMHKIAVLNQKGGTGKTTTAINLAAGLAQSGRRVLLIDMDAQGSVGVSLGINGEFSIYHVLIDGVPPQEAAVPIRDNLDVITANETVASAEIVLTNTSRREKVLRERCASLTSYDYVILDCAPSLSIMNQNALTFAESVLVPVACDYLSLVGVKQVLKTIRRIEELCVHPVEVLGVLPTFHDARARITHEVMRNLKGFFGEKVLPPIRLNTRLKEAPSHRKTIYEYAASSTAAQDYSRLTQRIEALLAARAGQPAVRMAV